MAVLGDLLSVNRRLLEEVRDRAARLQTHGKEPSTGGRNEVFDESNRSGSHPARSSDAPAGSVLRGPGQGDARARDAADRADRKSR
jgi:hypothetical protein